MGSGIGEPETIEFFAAGGGVSAEELLQTIEHLEVVAEDGAQYFYNNTLVAAAPYLVMLKDGTDPADLEERYAIDLASLVFHPIGMADAVVAADPRPSVRTTPPATPRISRAPPRAPRSSASVDTARPVRCSPAAPTWPAT